MESLVLGCCGHHCWGRSEGSRGMERPSRDVRMQTEWLAQRAPAPSPTRYSHCRVAPGTRNGRSAGARAVAVCGTSQGLAARHSIRFQSNPLSGSPVGIRDRNMCCRTAFLYDIKQTANKLYIIVLGGGWMLISGRIRHCGSLASNRNLYLSVA